MKSARIAEPLENKLDKIGEDIRMGRVMLAQEQLQKVCARGVPRTAAYKAAALARRVSLPDLGLRILHRIVRPSGRIKVPSTNAEQAEYAACLTKIGAVAEAKEILGALDATQQPEILLFAAYARAKSR